MDTNTSPVPIKADLYPAKVTYHNGKTLDPVKVLIGLDKIYIYTLTGNAGSHVATHPLDHLTGNTQHGYTATIGNQKIEIKRSSHCGCGTNKSWKPFNYRITMTPTQKY